MKTLKKITILMMLLTTTIGCGRKFEMKDVYISLPKDLNYFLSEFGISGGYEYDAYGDILYKAKEEIVPKNECIEVGDDFEDVPFFYISNLGDNQEYTITSNLHEGYKLSVKAEKYEDAYIYKKITLVHPLSMPYDSIVCTNVKYVGNNYGFELNEYASRPCSGKIKVYRVYEDGNYLFKEVVEATDEKTVWKEYYVDGSIKSIKTIVANPEELDEDGMFSACPFITKGQYYLPDGSESCEDIDKLDNLVEEIVRLQHLYYLTRDKSIEQKGDRLCRELNSFSRTMERQIKKGKYTLEQQDRINKIIDRLK